jgi:DNA replication protein DnaC
MGEESARGTPGYARMVTVGEAIASGLCTSPPPARRCPHCGRELEPIGMAVGARVYWVTQRPCGCAGARMARERERDEEGREAEASRRRRLALAGVGERYMDALPTERQGRSFARSFSPRGGNGLYIHGPVGVGKTHDACGVAREVLEAGHGVVFTTAAGMLGRIRETFDGGGSTAAAKARYARCDLLVLDDLGKEQPTLWSVATLFEVVNERYESLRPTVITSQLTLGELTERLSRGGDGETARAIASRLAGTCADVALSGGDRRTAARGAPMGEFGRFRDPDPTGPPGDPGPRNPAGRRPRSL